MTRDVQTLPVKNNLAENRFEVTLGDKLGMIIYRKEGSVYIMIHTEVPGEYEGQGIADHLAHEALEQVKAEHGQVVPLCPFVRAYIRRHPEYQPLVVSLPHQ
jgi:predicted GNAT family acetyltransferase